MEWLILNYLPIHLITIGAWGHFLVDQHVCELHQGCDYSLQLCAEVTDVLLNRCKGLYHILHHHHPY